MIPSEFAYSRASSLDDALKQLAAGGGNVKVLAGGQSLIPLMKLRLARPERLLDIGTLKELKGVRTLPDGRLGVGALTTYRELMDSKPIAHYGVLRDALPTIADVQVRNLGTVGGSIAHADPASDLPACLLALHAEIVARSAKGERRIPAREFFLGSFQSALAEDELLVEVILPAGLPNAGSAYCSLEQKASGYAIAGAAAVVVIAPDGSIAFASVGVTGVSDTPYGASGVEGALMGQKPSSALFAAAAEHAVDGKTVNSDIHADRDYRAAMAKIQVRRALEAAFARLS